MPDKAFLLFGFLGFLGLISFYFLTMLLLSGSFSATVIQFRQLWFWVIMLSFAFGVQVGFYVKLHRLVRGGGSKGLFFASGATSSVGMAACCAHHLVDVLPIVGLSTLSVFLLQYQKPILFLSLLVNLIGITVMVRNIRKIKADA